MAPFLPRNGATGLSIEILGPLGSDRGRVFSHTSCISDTPTLLYRLPRPENAWMFRVTFSLVTAE